MGFVFDASVGRLSARVDQLERAARADAPWFSPLDHGAAGDGVTDCSPAILAAQAAAQAAGGGTVLIPEGTFRCRSPIPMRSSVSLVGTGPASVLYFDPSVLTYYEQLGVIWEGGYPDYPSVRPIGDQHATALIPIASASQGSTTITASPTGGLDAVAAGDWLLICEGPSPKWNYKIQYSLVLGRSGDVVTLDRPLEFAFDGSSGHTYGVARITPIEDAWLENLTVRTSANALFGFGTGLAVRGGIRNCTFDMYMNPSTYVVRSNPANDVYGFEISGNTWLAGNFGGFNRSSHSRFVGNRLLSVAVSDGEYGEGAAFCTYMGNTFSGCRGTNPVLGIGGGWHFDVIGNDFVGVDSAVTLNVIGGMHVRILGNTLYRVREFAINVGSSSGYSSGVVTSNVQIVGNHVELKSSVPLSPASAYPAIGVHEYPNVSDVVVASNWVSHSIKLGTGNWQDDRRTIRVVGNTGPGVSPSLPEPTNITLGAASIGSSTVATPASLTRSFDAGETYITHNTLSSGSQGFVITVGGTNGTLLGVTGSINSGETDLTVNSATDLKPGQYVTIAGVSGIKKIVSVSGLIATIDSTASATVSGAAVAFSAPSWNYLPGSAAASQADSVAATVGALVTDFNSLLAKLRTAKILT